MKKRNVGLIVAIIVIAVVIIVIGVLAALYFFTDLFKTEEQLFWKYLSKNSQVLDIMSNENAEIQEQWKKENSYTSQGSLKLNVTNNSGTKEITLGTTSKHNNSNGRTYSDMTLYNEGEELLKASYINSGDIYAVQCQDIYEPYYIGFRNSNLKEFATNMGLSEEEIAQIPDSIPFDMINNQTQLTEKEMQYLVVTYGKILMDNIADEKYSKIEKTNISIENQNYEAVGYSLTLNQDDIKQIVVAILTKAKDDEQTIAILNKLISDENQTEQINVQEILEQSLNDLQNQNFEETTITISVYHEGNKIIKTQINLNNIAEFTMDLNMNQEDKNYLAFTAEAAVNDSENEAQGTVMQFTMEKQILNSIVYYTTNITSGVSDYQITMNTTLGNIVNNQMENNSKITIINSDATVEASYAKTIQLATEEVEIQELTDTNSVIINNYPAEQLNTFFTQISENSSRVLTDKIGQLNIQMADYKDILNYAGGLMSSFITIINANGVEQPVGIIGITMMTTVNATVENSMKKLDEVYNSNNEFEKIAINEKMTTIQQLIQIDYLSGKDFADINTVKTFLKEQFLNDYEIVDFGDISFNSSTQKLEGSITIVYNNNMYLLNFTNMTVDIKKDQTNNNNAESVINALNAQSNRNF